MKLTTRVADPGGNLYWYSYPENKKIMSWDQDTSIQEIMDFIANLPEKRDMAEFRLP